MRSALVNENADLFAENNKYIMQITGDNEEGKRELDSFINPSEPYPVIATTSKLMTTGVDAQTCKLIVLDSNIGSMTEFKQIIGRGTRINEEYGKTYFTIMDFRNVTNLFADPDFDGDPVMIKDVSEDDDIIDIEDETTDEPIIDVLDGSEVQFPEESDYPEIEGGGIIIEEPRGKIPVNGVEVKIINERVQYLGIDGKIITESLTDYTKNNITKQYVSLESFLNSWNKAETKKAIIDELEEQGVFFEALKEAKPLTRKERANNVKKRNYFTKYGEKAQLVLNSLLDKYADDGLLTIENTEVLKLDPLNKLGTPIELVKAFGGKSQYVKALKELENYLYG
jgi:type I restriction enzyme R subunit